MTFGDRLKKARENASLTQGELGERCGWKAAQTRIANYESNEREPTLEDIQKMAREIGVPPEELAFEALGLSEAEANLIQAWRLADPDTREVLRGMMRIARRPRRNKSQSPKGK